MADAAPKASRLPSPVLPPPPGFVLPVHAGSEHRHAWSDEWIQRVLFRPSLFRRSPLHQPATTYWYLAMDRSELDSASAMDNNGLYTPSFPLQQGTAGTRQQQAMLGQGPGARAEGNDTGWLCATYNVAHDMPQRLPAPARDGSRHGDDASRPCSRHEATLTLQHGIRATERGLAPDTRNFPQRPTHQLTRRARHLPIAAAGKAGAAASLQAFSCWCGVC